MKTPALTLLPAVDVAGGQAVRLVQGAAGTETGYGDPLAAALAWQAAGAEWVHLVDLDAAFGRGSNADLLAAVVARLGIAVELSGGIRDDASLAALWKSSKRVFLWVPEYGILNYIKQSNSYHLARSGRNLILMNRTWPIPPSK